MVPTGKMIFIHLWKNFIFTALIETCFSSPIGPADVEPTSEIEGLEGSVVQIPCHLFPADPEDKINLILWYRDDQKDPMYSFDARMAVFSSERHHLKQANLTGRVDFTLSPGPPIPHKLTITKLTREEEGIYTCRVDFTMAQSSMRAVRLKVVSQVSSLMILDSQGRQTPSVLPPIPEGGTLNITCTARGGRPQPAVSWWVEDGMIDDSWTEMTKGVISNNLVLSPLTRAHAHAVLKCKAIPSPIAVRSVTVQIDMYLKPESVEISGGGDNGHVKAGEYLDLTCSARGSRPAPKITWFKGSDPIPEESVSMKELMGVSVISYARFKVRKEDNGVRVTCRVINEKLPHYSLQEHVALNVTFKPEVSLRMGMSLDGTVVKEKTDLYLTCYVDANPPPTSVTFTHQGVVVQQNRSKGIVITGKDLVLRGIERNQGGTYTCRASNTHGVGISPPMNITVLYAPVCKTAHEVWAEPGKNVNASCSVNASPDNDIYFSWVWVAPPFSRRIMASHIATRGLQSNVSFTVPQVNRTITEMGPSNVLGTLQCWAENKVGKQKSPCKIQVRRPTSPASPVNCTLKGDGREAVKVTCQSGDATSIPQTYQLQIYEATTQKLHVNVTSPYPSFVIRNLTAGRDYTVYVSSHNSYGGSPFRLVEAFNFKTAENRMREDNEDPISWMYIIIFAGCVGGVILVILFATAIIRLRLRRSQHKCTVRRTTVTEPKRVSKSIYVESPAEPSTVVEKRPSLADNPLHVELTQKIPPREPPQPIPIIRQPSANRLPPIIKENGRTEPVKNSQPRTVLFVEPPKSRSYSETYKEDLPRRNYNHDSLYPPRRTGKPHVGREDFYTSRGPYTDPLQYPDTGSAYPVYRGSLDENMERDDYHRPYSPGGAALRSSADYLPPRNILYRSNTLPGTDVTPPPRSLPREQPHFRYKNRDPDASYHSVSINRSSPPPRPSIMKKSPSMSGSVYNRYDGSRPEPGTTYRSLPRPNKPRHEDPDGPLNRYKSLDRRFDIPFTGSLPRPERRDRSPREEVLPHDNRDDSIPQDRSETRDNRFDRQNRQFREPHVQRRVNSSNRLRFSDEKYFHVYPEKDKRQDCVDDVDENFV